jgi:PAS domain S-box-containing protein
MDADGREQPRHALGQHCQALAPGVDEACFQALFARAPFAVALAGRRRRLLACNPAYEALVGYRAAELRGRSFPTVTHPDDASQDLALYRELVAGCRDYYSLEKRYLHKNGRVIWGHLTASLVRAAPGAAPLALGLVTDLAPWRRTEASLRQLETQCRALADVFAAGVPLVAPPGPALPDVGATERPPDPPLAPTPAGPARATPVAAALTGRERQVLDLIAHGYRYKEIAARLFIAPKTVEAHVGEVLRKLEARTPAEAVYRALQQGLLSLNPADDRDTGPTRPPPQHPTRR